MASEHEDNMNEVKELTSEIDKLAKSLDKANNKIDKLVDGFSELSKYTSDIDTMSIIINKSRKSNKKASSEDDEAKQKEKEAKKKEDQKNKSIKSFESVVNIFSSGKTASSVSSLSSALGILGPEMMAVAGAVGLTVEAVKILSKITLDAQKNTVSYARSLTEMNKNMSGLDKLSYYTSKSMNDLKNRWENTLQTLGELFEPLLTILTELGNLLLFFASPSERKDIRAGVEADIVTKSKQKGFSSASSEKLASGTYALAASLGKTFKDEQISEIAKKLADAWMNGSDAAREYGIVVNDTVLEGWLAATKGIDIVNVEITEAQRQYYRYLLMLEEAAASDKTALQDMIKQWTELGFIIDKTKNKLFSFDEVIQLTAIDANIPEVTEGGVYSPDTGESVDTGGFVWPPFPSFEWPPYNLFTWPLIPKPSWVWDLIPKPSWIWDAIQKPGWIWDLIPKPSWVWDAIQKPGWIWDLIPKPSWVWDLIPKPGWIWDLIPKPSWVWDNIPEPAWVVKLLNGLNTDPSPAPASEGVGVTSSNRVTSTVADHGYATGAQHWTDYLEEVNKGLTPSGQKASTGTSGAYAGVTGQAKSSLGVVNGTSIGISDQLWDIWTGEISSGNLSSGIYQAFEKGGSKLTNDSKFGNAGTFWQNAMRALSPFIPSGVPAYGFADGGIGTREVSGATLFENNKKEAIIPLESQQGIDFLSNALRQASMNNEGMVGDNLTINVNLSGLNVADNDAQWQIVGNKIAEIIDVQHQRRGDLNYGSTF